MLMQHNKTLQHKKQLRALKFGDMIQFESSTKRNGNQTVWRMVTGWYGSKPTVRFYGQTKLVVELNEILAIET